MKRLLFIAVAILTFASCTIYHPQAVDIPLINHAGDTRVDVAMSMSMWAIPDAVNVNATVSHGFNDWLTGQVHLNYGGDNYYGQVAPGYYLPLGEKSVFEAYAGYGYGGANRDDKENKSEDFKGHYHLPFVQFNIGWHDLTAANIDLGFGMKTGYFMCDYEYHKYKDGVETRFEKYNTPNMLFEPQLMFRIGGEKVRFNVKLGIAIMSELENSNDNMIYDVATGSVGLTFVF